VDEFQDTSISQFHLFEKLLAGWEVGDGRSFFAVGDPMQSIYRFRDAEVSLFLRAGQYGIAGVALEPLQLEVNFRSDVRIVDWCNQTFSGVFPEQSDMTAGAVCYAPSVPMHNHAQSAEPEFHADLNVPREVQAERVAELVADSLQATEDDAGTVAILVRSKTVLSEIFTALQMRAIAYQAIDIETLGERLVVKDVLSLCRALQHPHDRIHWFALLRAPWCGLTLHDLHVFGATGSKQTIWAALQDQDRLAALSEQGRARVSQLCSVLQPALRRVGREPLVPWIESIWLKLGGPASCKTSQDLFAAEVCFAELAAIEDEGLLADASHVSERMARLFAPVAEGEAARVQIMTIHKSKGLEFDSVILPALERMPRSDDTRLLNWFEYFSDDANARLLLAPISATNIESEDASPIVRLVKRLQGQKSANELLRLLYVAATRAKRRLHLLASATQNTQGELKTPPKASLLAPLWPQLQDEFKVDDQPSSNATASDIDQEPPPLSRLTQDWRCPPFAADWLSAEAFAQAESDLSSAGVTEAISFDWAGDVARHIGTVVHRQIQRIADDGPQLWSLPKLEESLPVYRKSLQAAGVAKAELDAATVAVCTSLTSMLTDPRGQWLLEPHTLAQSEYKLTGLVAGELVKGVIDRTFVDEKNVRWIVDYKTGSHKSKQVDAFLDREQVRYSAQLDRYAGIMARMEEREIRLGLYFPLIGGWREWQYNALSGSLETTELEV